LPVVDVVRTRRTIPGNVADLSDVRNGSPATVLRRPVEITPRKRTFRCAALGDAPGRKRVNALHQILSSFDYLAGLNQQSRQNVDAERSCHL